MTDLQFKDIVGLSPEVVVIGLGPVGITLCNILGSMGVRTLGVDARQDIYPLPRAIGMDHEVMRIFQNIGIVGSLGAVVGEYRDSEYHAADGTLLRRFISPPPPHKLGWPAYLTFVQPELERVLRERIDAWPSVSTMTGVQLVSLAQPETPSLTFRHIATDETVTLAPAFVVACDGGTSFVRNSLDIKFEDLIFDQPWLVVDVILGEGEVNLPETNVQFCDPARPHTFVVLPGKLRRWEFMMLPGETPEEMSQPAKIWDLLSKWIKPGEADIWRSATYRFHALVAESWGRGNVFLAGDACHMTPPFLAQGMVQGIKDTSNLGWKLASVLKGAPRRLLDTYEQERRPLVRKVIKITKELGEIICELDEAKAAVRNESMKALVDGGRGELVRQELFPPIEEGMIAHAPGGEPMPGAGQICPQPRLQQNGTTILLDHITGSCFTLLVYGLDLARDTREAADALGVSVIDFGGRSGAFVEEGDVLRNWFENLGARAVLVRPDHVVFGAASHESQLRAMLSLLSPWLNAGAEHSQPALQF